MNEENEVSRTKTPPDLLERFAASMISAQPKYLPTKKKTRVGSAIGWAVFNGKVYDNGYCFSTS